MKLFVLTIMKTSFDINDTGTDDIVAAGQPGHQLRSRSGQLYLYLVTTDTASAVSASDDIHCLEKFYFHQTSVV